MAHLLARIAPRARRTSLPTVGAAALALLSLCPLLWLYARSAAPSVLAGDSAEFQFAAPLLGVPHPTGYPLYILLGKLASLLPLGDVAHRVTMLSALLAAATCSVVALLALRLTGRPLAALLAALALGVTPGVWNAATIAEVYALNLLLIAALGYALLRLEIGDWESGVLGPTLPALRARTQQQPANLRSPAPNPPISNLRWLYAACLLAGLGISHHASFALIAAPLLLASLVSQAKGEGGQAKGERRKQSTAAAFALRLSPFALCLLLGLSPWLLVLGSYAAWGPFDGDYHGLPRHYFWGAPTSWGAALAHLAGGPLRGEVFALPDGARLLAAADALLQRMRFEWGSLGLLLGALGSAALLWRAPRVWLASAWVFVAAAAYFACLSRAVQDALIFTLPMLLPWALWIGVGAATLADVLGAAAQRIPAFRPSPFAFRLLPAALLCALLALTLQWGRTRLPYGNKHDQWLFRQFGQGALARVEPGAVVLARWEQGTILLYLHLVERQRPDVLLDVVEPEDWPWGPRVAERYRDRPVYVVGGQADADALGARPVWGTGYAGLFRLK
jgi:hypothetical protein